MTAAFFLNSKRELLKCKNTPAFWLTVIGAAFIPLVNAIKYIAKPDHFVPLLADDPWGVLVMHNWQIAASFLMVIYIILVTSLVVQIEYASNTWKQIYASPRSYGDIFFSKFAAVHVMVLSCLLLFNVFMIVSGYLVSRIDENYLFTSSTPVVKEMLVISARMYVSVLAVTVIQYWLSLRFRNFAVAMGLGMALYITGLMIRQWEYIHYYPYMLPFLAYFPNPGLPPGVHDRALVNSVVTFLVGTVLAFLEVAHRPEKG